MTTMQWIYGFTRKTQTNIPGAIVATAIEWDGDDILANTRGTAWRGLDANGKDGMAIVWRRAGEGEVSRDGLMIVQGNQWGPSF